jgi:hypothetical protein
MLLEEIPHEQWRGYLDQFSRAHRDAESRLETAIDGKSECRNASKLPLIGITDEQIDHDEHINIMLGSPPAELGEPSEASLNHTVEHPVRMRACEWNDGYSGAIEIESADGSWTVLQVGPVDQTLPNGMITDGII